MIPYWTSRHPFVILGVTFDFKMLFDAHIWNVASSAGRAFAIVRRANTTFGAGDEVHGCFLSRLEHCAPVCISATSKHL